MGCPKRSEMVLYGKVINEFQKLVGLNREELKPEKLWLLWNLHQIESRH